MATILFSVLLLIFVFFAGSFARNLKEGIIPDERVHIAYSRYFTTTWGIPADSPETYPLGSIAHKPFLYYWINGRVLNLVSPFLPSTSTWKTLITLRLWNIFYGILTVLFCYLLAKEVIENRWWLLLVVFFLTNTLMFVFLSGGVNYDNLANLSCFASAYFLVRVFKGKSFYLNSLAWLNSLMIGTLTKITVLPLALIMGLCWIVYVLKSRRQINFRVTWGWSIASLLAVFIVLTLINLWLYGENLVKYKTVSPTCNQVLTEEQCNLNPIIRREKRVAPAEKLSYRDMLLGNIPDPVAWFLDYWSPTLPNKIYGIFGHKIYSPTVIPTFYRLFIVWVILIVVRYWKKPSFTVGSLIAIFGFYILVLLMTNYQAELTTNFKHYGVQGRYIFPVIGIIYILSVYFLSIVPNRRIARASAVMAFSLFLWGGPLVASFAKAPDILPETPIESVAPIGEVVEGIEVSQELTFECNGRIDQFILRLPTNNRLLSHPLIFRLRDLTRHQDITVKTIPGEAIPDNSFYSFSLAPFLVSSGSIYGITITSPNSLPGKAINLLGSASDIFPRSEAKVNGKPTGTDLYLHYRCIQSAFAGWFK